MFEGRNIPEYCLEQQSQEMLEGENIPGYCPERRILIPMIVGSREMFVERTSSLITP